MNLYYELLTESFELNYGDYCNFTMENILEFRRIVENIDNQEVICLYEDESVVKNYNVIPNALFLDFSDKKIINKVIKDLLATIKNEEHYKHTIELNSDTVSYINEIIFDYPYSLDIDDEVDFSYIFKSVGLKLEVDYDSYLDKLISYLDMYQKIFNTYIFYTINLSNYLTSEELMDLKHYIEINDILIINYDTIYIENKSISNRILFDNDLCRII